MQSILFKKFTVVNHYWATLALIACLLTVPINTYAQLPNPTYGWNLGNTFESTWGYPSPTQAVFTTAANAGFNAVRIPCAWDYNSNQTTHQINASYMAQVKQAVDWAIGAGMYVVINDHWDGGWLENHIDTTVDPTINAKMNAYWTQIATTFAGYDNHLLFAAANEPNVSSPAKMTTLLAYYQTFINAVRGVGGNNTNRWLVLQGGGDTSWLTVNNLPSDPTPGRLMVEYHNYTPYQFTQLGSDASWGRMFYFWGPAYHYSGDPTRNASWGEEGTIDSGFQQLDDMYVNQGIPVMIGEFQAAGKGFLTGTEATYNRASCLYWNKYLVDSAHGHGLSPFYWSTPNSPFDYNTGADLSPDVVNVLTGGIAPPPPNGAPYAVTSLTATANGSQISLSWTGSSGATSYNLYRAAESGGETTTPIVTGLTGTSYTDTGLNSGTTYYYQVVAINSSGPSGFSPEAHATTPGINQDPTQFNFEYNRQSWAANGSQISGVATSTAQHYAGSQSLAINFNGTAAGSSSVYVTNLAIPAGTTVTFHIWIPSGNKISLIQPYIEDYNWAWYSSSLGVITPNAWNTATLTIPSTAITPVQQIGLSITMSAAWTGTCYLDSISWPVTPTAATGLTASAGDSQVSLSWTASTYATSYKIYRSTTPGGEGTTPIASGITDTSYTNLGLTNGTTYYYKVAAVNGAGTSALSSEASATPTLGIPSVPAGLSATGGNARVSLTWTAVTGAASYKVYRSTISGGEGTTPIASGIATASYVDTNVTNGTKYFYKVAAVNSAGTSAQSSEVSATPLLPAISSVSPTQARANTSIALTVNGSNFRQGSVITWNGTTLSTTFVSSSKLTATVSQSLNPLLTSYPGSGSVQVIDPDQQPCNQTSVKILAPVIHTFNMGVQMVSAPLEYSDSFSNVIECTGAMMCSWNPINLSYIKSPASPADTFHAGRGYWCLFPAQANLLDTGAHISSTTTVTVSLSRGWNMIGSPRVTTVAISNLNIKDQNGNTLTTLNAVNKHIIYNVLYTYPAGSSNYTTALVGSGSLSPYAGYWIYAYQPCTLVF